jgi:hypothetical protein
MRMLLEEIYNWHSSQQSKRFFMQKNWCLVNLCVVISTLNSAYGMWSHRGTHSNVSNVVQHDTTISLHRQSHGPSHVHDIPPLIGAHLAWWPPHIKL